MVDLIENKRNKLFQDAIKQPYPGAVFDIDGTLTNRGQEFIPDFVLEVLANIGLKVPVAVCTGRNLQLALEKIAPVFARASDAARCQNNWILICENGNIGYAYNSLKKNYDEIFRIHWPYSEIEKINLFKEIKGILGNKTGECFMNPVTIVFRPNNADQIDNVELAKRSRELANIIQDHLRKIDHKKLLKIGDSGIGVIIFNHIGNKEIGAEKFAEFLRAKGFEIGPDGRELLIVGDQPGPMGNDEGFLNGKFGTAFTVGETNGDKIYPLPVFENKQIIKGPHATVSLLNRLKFIHHSL